MPYIKKLLRRGLDVTVRPASAGELNYTISHIINTYLQDERVSYASINEVIGVLECAKLELYRRVAADYEDQKCAENGDVYTCGTP